MQYPRDAERGAVDLRPLREEVEECAGVAAIMSGVTLPIIPNKRLRSSGSLKTVAMSNGSQSPCR